MSAPGAASPTIDIANGTVADLELDVTKLHSLPSEQQDLYLLAFVSDFSRHVRKIDGERLAAHQASIKSELIKLLELTSPAPSRVIRNSLGRIFADVFLRGSRGLLYETINDLLGFINAGKGEKDLANKHAAVVCIGQIFEAVGDSAISLSNLTCASLVRLTKQAQNHAGLRGCIARALASIIKGLGTSVDEQAARDAWKYTRNASTDKSLFVQRHACACLQQLVLSTTYFDNSNDFESLKATIWKSIESPAAPVRHAAAGALGAALVKAAKGTSANTAPQIRKPKKTKKVPQDADEEIDAERPGSPSSRKVPIHLSMSLPEVLKVLSTQYCRPSVISKRARVGIAACYKYVLLQLPDTVVEENYGIIANHFFVDLLSHPIISRNRYRLLLTRKIVGVLLEEVIGTSILSEAAQLTAAQWLIDEVLKAFPQPAEGRREPSKRALTSALSALRSLVSGLGSAFGAMGDSCREALVQIIQHHSYTVQIHVADCLRALAFNCPHQLLPCVSHCQSKLETELSYLSEPRHSHRRCVAFATSLAAITSVSRSRPLYISVGTTSQLFNSATGLLKASSSSELRVSATQIQVAWILIGGLLPLGPNFVKIHLSQLLLLWRNALPMPLARDNVARRGSLESSFLAHVRECALGAMFVFFEHNGSLLTLDGSKRIAAMLQNTIVFLESLSNHAQSDEVSSRLFTALDLSDIITMVRRRVLQCFAKLISHHHLENADLLSQSNVVNLAISSLTETEVLAPRGLETTIANATGNFETLWDTSDNWGFGVNGLVRGYNIELFPKGRLRETADYHGWAILSQPKLDKFLLSPILQAREHDSVLLYAVDAPSDCPELDPPTTRVVNAAIELFALALPLQPPKVQESCLEQLATFVAQPLQREPGRRIGVNINIFTALLGALMVANRETVFSSGQITASGVDRITAEILRRAIADPDSSVRNLGIEAMGRLSNICGSHFTNAEVNYLIDSIVSNRDPYIRSGCAGALGCIHSQVGSMAAGFHLTTIVSVLLTLCKDPHPVVHYWSLQSLGRVADSAGLTFSGHVVGTLGMLALVYTSDSHNDEASSVSTSSLEVEHSTPSVVGHCVESLINVLGPDLQDVSKPRNMIMTLVHHLEREQSPLLVIHSLLCLGHLSMYAPAHLDFPDYVKRLQAGLIATEETFWEVSVEGLNSLMKRDSRAVIEAADPGLDELIWLSLDRSPGHPGLQNMIQTWLQQTFLVDSAAWVKRCQEVLSKTRVKVEVSAPPKAIKSTAVPDLQDEEVAGFAAAAATLHGESADALAEGQEFLKWQTRTFAVVCLSRLLALVTKARLPDQTIPAEAALQSKIAEIVRMAFSASTADVNELRIWGLRIIDQILKLFGKTPDPEFLEASLLEQYQAQIGSALTPAFAAESSPELAAEALNVCASFVATGIVTSVERMGRIFKLLVTALENISNTSEYAAIGDLKVFSTNAQAMLKMATLSAWAQLQIASIEQKYLESIVQPYLSKLTPLWLASLQEFAKLRFEPEISSSFGGDSHSGDLDELYAALNRQIRLSFYQDSWLYVVEAIAVLVERDSDHVFDALDGKSEIASEKGQNGIITHGRDMSFREEPVAFFFILYGLAFEALVTQPQERSSQTLAILQALKKILKPAVSGHAVYQDLVFNETMDALERIALTEGTTTQGVLVEMSRNLALDHISVQSGLGRDEKLSDDIEQLFELTRIMMLILGGLLPTLQDPPGTMTRLLTEDGTALIQLSLEALVDVAEIFPAVIRADLHASILHIFCAVLANGACQATAVPLALPVFKRFLQAITKPPLQLDGMTRLVRGCLSRFSIILQHAQRRESEFALLCAKNTLLAITILMTSAGSVIPPHDILVEQAISEIMSCLQDLGLSKVAAKCLRSLLLISPKTPCDESVARYLYPRLLSFIHDKNVEDPENARALIAHALTSSVGALPSSGRLAAVAMLIPPLLARAHAEGEGMYKETALRLLELAALDQLGFRAIVASMPPAGRSLFEDILRSGSDLSRQADVVERGTDSKPTIELRTDF